MTDTRPRRLPRKTRRRFAERRALQTLLRVLPLRREGLTLQSCCDRLNADGWTTFAGHPWRVSRLAQITKHAQLSTFERVSKLASPRKPEARIYVAAALAQLTEELEHV